MMVIRNRLTVTQYSHSLYAKLTANLLQALVLYVAYMSVASIHSSKKSSLHIMYFPHVSLF